ncbi:MAG: molybdenum cofactor guanylyltransferase [Deltaproteobacteria bacterium]
MKTGCIILAGGKGRRLGQEKSWVEVGGSTLLQRAVSHLEFFNSEIIIVKAPEGKLPAVSSVVNLKVVQDYVGGKGPLAGLLAGLVNSQYKNNLLVACDMPFLNKDLIRYLASLTDGDYDAVVPRMGQYLEPLQAIYSKNCIPEIEELLAQDKLNVDGLFNRMRTRFVVPSEIEPFDPKHLSFININTPADLEKAEAILGKSEG